MSIRSVTRRAQFCRWASHGVIIEEVAFSLDDEQSPCTSNSLGPDISLVAFAGFVVVDTNKEWLAVCKVGEWVG